MNTYNATATEHYAETLNSTGCTDYPCQSDKEDHTKDVLDTWQVNTYEGTHSCSASRGRGRFIRVSRGRDGVAVVRQAVEQRRNSRPILHLLL